jgi:hypothetical protein
MDELFKAISSLAPQKKKIHTVNVQGKELEVSLEKKIEIQRAGEDAFILQGDEIVRKPIVRASRKLAELKKNEIGCHFYDGDPFWVERIAEEGYAWQIESE